MDFGLTDEQQLLLESLDELLERECPESYIADLDATHQPPTTFRRAMNEAGFGSLGFPEEFGGTPSDALTLVMLAERVARQGLNNGYGLELLQAKDILEFGSPEQQQEILGLLAAGDVPFALGFTEPGAGSDNSAMTTSAVHHDGVVTFNGTKTLITNALQSKYLLLMAKNPDVEDPRKAISMYLVPMDAPGVTTNRLEKILWHISDSCEIFLDDVTLPESCLVGVKGNGFKQLMRNFELERLVIAANCLGMAQCAFDDAATYAAQRVQFGKPIGSFQLIQLKLTDMAIKLENIRNFVYKTAWMVDQGEPLKSQGALCKRYSAMAAFEVADEAMQIFGGVGVTIGTRVSRLWLDLRGHRFGGGTDEIMVHIAGRQIVKDHS
ncbi:acyl-CoA dehydrogenase (plasmid) [Cellulomonas sp. WB94]|jgi:crotonobetainyl-CoA dehydrogenase|uniref:acyl-CoA dehydrogenase family protein n=1 Tax=unclassified Cellulomonas TaxID=2620175 RepID=UPI000D5640E3|nr:MULTISPECIES: acyl-CoA dehydrogenase family protein [unclassified Cellulomonas]PVU84411.1 acyl-CoA dehydrogenase [Cellulomonas sp. WB94]HEX5331044.1 acyl-CoA dehydrogenase family protein [Cellulomonas sp.]